MSNFPAKHELVEEAHPTGTSPDGGSPEVDQAQHTSDATTLKEGEALLEILTDKDGSSSFHISFQTTEEFIDEIEARRKDRVAAAQKETKEKFRRRNVSESESLAQFKKLGNEWFYVAIGFLKVVPDLTDRNFVYIRREVASSVSDFAESVAIGKMSLVDEFGVITDKYTVKKVDLPIILRKMGQSLETVQAAGALAKSSLGALVSDYEAFISNLLRAMAGLKQEIILSSTDTVQIGSLLNFSSFDEVVDDLIDDKIQEHLQSKTHLQVLKWIEDRCGVNLTSDKEMIRDFVEVCQRRNLLIHAGGKVNKKYRRVCEEEGWKPADLANLGEEVDVSRRYLRRATARVFLVGFFTLHILWQKMLPKHRDDSIEQLLGLSHDFLDNGLTKMSRRICDFALGSSKGMSAKMKAYFTINLAQSYLFDPDSDDEKKDADVKRILETNDWSMAPPVVQLAIKCLRRDFVNFSDCVDKAIADGLSYSQAQTWSVFREARLQTGFVEKFR